MKEVEPSKKNIVHRSSMVIASLLAVCAFQGFYGLVICQFFPERAHTLGPIMFWLGGFTLVLAIAAYRGDMTFKTKQGKSREEKGADLQQ